MSCNLLDTVNIYPRPNIGKTMTDRLDRVESILADIADRLDRTESRLERTEVIANSNSRAIEANSNDMASLKEAERSLFASQERALIGLSDTMSEVVQRMDRTHAEIRGLRTETRRILERRRTIH